MNKYLFMIYDRNILVFDENCYDMIVCGKQKVVY